ncbi:hypothetical protein B0A48_05569 [Cryoendolithus antarcticus]|uniref:Uncharacterized protein n=1 Tax=Cryoendolithus antarcticus TaxID=1507870 RepID=A0A1V8TIU4_9PEZI|nr:hypothetical protein B0A48_05569 [Cryoendolithus antarcticus]
MAFQQPQHRPQSSRQISIPQVIPEQAAVPASPLRKRTLRDSQEWILFSPAQREAASQSSQAPRTATYTSDLGSLETHIRSQAGVEDDAEAAGEEDGELDSLDDGLKAFDHDPLHSGPYRSLDQSGATPLWPTHDGLGTFASGTGLQEQLWQFERHNPQRRRSVRRPSVPEGAVEELGEAYLESERRERIERWRVEQSRAVVEEIEKETKRRGRGRSSVATNARPIKSQKVRQVAVMSEEGEGAQGIASEGESWWQRITRRVIQDLIGLDENTLSVIFGEQLPEDPSPTLTQTSPIAAAAATESQVTFRNRDHTWEAKLIDRIARELNVLVAEFASQDGNAFNTYAQPSELAAQRVPDARLQHRRRLSRHSRQVALNASIADSNLFRPTLPTSPGLEHTDTSLWGIEEEPATPQPNADTQAREFYTRSLNLSTILSYLASRFSPAPPVPAQSTPLGPLPASWATTSTPTMSRAEHIRLHHPLLSSRAAEIRRRDSVLKRRMGSLGSRSSCKSQSGLGGRGGGSVSSRCFWEFGGGTAGSEGVFSEGVSAGGGWGEV